MYKSEAQLKELQRLYDLGLLKPTAKEKIVINPKLAYEVTSEDIVGTIPLKEIEANPNKYGQINRFSKITPTDNLAWDFLFFRDPNYFRPAALAFEQSKRNVAGTKQKPRYTHHARGTRAWKEFWIEEGRRIIKGYEPIIDGKPCGLRIPGELYFYLNYGWIKKIVTDKETGEVVSDESGFPDFLAMDYYFIKELESRENPKLYGFPSTWKQSLAVVKARRLGFSYKASAGAVWKTLFDRLSLVIIASGTGDDAATCFAKSMELVQFLTDFTPFGLEDIGRPANNGGWKHADSSTKQTKGFITFAIKSTRTTDMIGRKSTIKTVSLFNEDDAISGEGLSRLYMEEAGKITNIKNAWTFAKPAMKVGKLYRNGIAVMFGTGGEMVGPGGKAGSSAGLKDFFYKPASADLAEYDNIYDYKPDKNKCGLFFSAMWYYKALPIHINGQKYFTIDSNGNPFFWVAEIVINQERAEMIRNKTKKTDYEKFLTQIAKTPSEAFFETKGSIFQTEDLMRRRTEIETSRGGYHFLRTPGQIIEYQGKDGEMVLEFVHKPDLEPITTSTLNSRDREGCLLQYAPPRKNRDLRTGKYYIPEDAYIISVDPIAMNNSEGGSLIAIQVFNTGKYPGMGEEGIVASYYGRPKENPVDYMCRLLLKLSKYYNAQISFENDRGESVFGYFLKHGELRRLMPMPQFAMTAYIKSTRTALRQYGHAMASPKHKEMGERLIYEWLDQRDSNTVHFDEETGEKLVTEGKRNIDMIKDELLLEQLIAYDRDGNYDAVSAFMGIMIQMKEKYDIEEKMYEGNEESSNDLEAFYNKVTNKYK